MAQDNIFDAREILALGINSPASVDDGSGRRDFMTVPDALAFVRDGQGDAHTLYFRINGAERAFDGARLDALVNALPEPRA